MTSGPTNASNKEHLASIKLRSFLSSALLTRFVDDREQALLASGTKLPYVFSAAGHELAQAMMAANIDDRGDGVFSYYRSKCVWLSVGLTLQEYASSAFQLPDSYAGGRSLSVLPYCKPTTGPLLAPVFGGVGCQFEPALGWARAIKLDADGPSRALSFVFAGDGAVSTGGFWSAIREAATADLPLVIVVENNDIALATPSSVQFPGGRVSDLFRSFPNLSVHWFDGTVPENFAKVQAIIQETRISRQPTLIEFKVPRLSGHSGAYRSNDAPQNEFDLRQQLSRFVTQTLHWSDSHFGQLVNELESQVGHVFDEVQRQAKTTLSEAHTQATRRAATTFDRPFQLVHAFGQNRVSVGHAINCWLRNALSQSPEIILMGEDIGLMGGAHGVTRGLQNDFGSQRVVDSALNEGSILGQAMGLAFHSYRPIIEIQFRRYLDPAIEQFHNVGWCEWLTGGAFKLPIIVRVPFGGTSSNDPWHSESGEAEILCAVGYDVACPTSSQDVIDMLDTAYVNQNPTVLLEHRDLYYSSLARQTLTNVATVDDAYRAKVLRPGSDMTIVSWGKCVLVARELADEIEGIDCEVIDLRWLRPWDLNTVFESVRKTKRCLVVHEDRRFMGFGAEVSATVSEQLFGTLVSPVVRIGATNNPVPVAKQLVDATLPTKEDLRQAILTMMGQ